VPDRTELRQPGGVSFNKNKKRDDFVHKPEQHYAVPNRTEPRRYDGVSFKKKTEKRDDSTYYGPEQDGVKNNKFVNFDTIEIDEVESDEIEADTVESDTVEADTVESDTEEKNKINCKKTGKSNCGA